MSVFLGVLDAVFWHALLWSVATVTGVGLVVQGLIWLLGKKGRRQLRGLQCTLKKRRRNDRNGRR